jgi:hypothetical protein
MRRAISLASVSSSGVEVGRHARGAQDLVGVLVLGDVVDGDGAVLAARRNDRNLAIEGDMALQDGRLARHCRKRALGIGQRGDARLALAVVAEPAGLEHRRGADARQRLVVGTGHGCERGHGDPEAGDELLFRQTILGDAQGIPPRRHTDVGARRSSTATGTFSNSKVTTSTAAAKRSSAASSS